MRPARYFFVIQLSNSRAVRRCKYRNAEALAAARAFICYGRAAPVFRPDQKMRCSGQ